MELTLLFLVKDNQVLLAMKKRGFGAGRFNGVGGKVEPGETIEQALIRESQEEISVTPVEFEKMADITFDEFYKGQPAILHVTIFTATKWEGTPTESEEMAPKWFLKSEIPYENMWPDDIYWLSQVIDGVKIKAHFKLDQNDAIQSHEVVIMKNF